MTTNLSALRLAKTPSSFCQLQAQAELEKRKRSGTSSSTAYSTFQAKYRSDPASFARDCIEWHGDDGLSGYQEEILNALAQHRRATCRGPHGLGKTALASIAILWFALTRDGDDWKIPTTASAWRQLTKFLWPEIRKWSRRVKWHTVGREPFNERTELLSLSLKLSTGEAFAMASDNEAMIEGAHASNLLFVFDESKTIPAATFDAAEGALSVGDCYALAISTPGEPNGRFYDIHARKPGYDDWWVRHVKLEEAIDAGRISRQWAEQRLVQWGEHSAVYQNRVLGEFASSEEDGVIPLAWVELANERWREWEDAGRRGTFSIVGVDVARSGEDKTVMAMLYDKNIVAELRRFSKEDTMQTADRVEGILRAYQGKAVIDVIGVGAGVVDRLRQYGRDVLAFCSSEHTDSHDKSGELGFTNVRSAAWWNMRELLDPSNALAIALPPDDKLTGDLTAPHWKVMAGGRIQIEGKEELKKRLGRSPDDGDAVIMAFFGTIPVKRSRTVII